MRVETVSPPTLTTGVGGLIADHFTVDLIWRRMRTEYRNQLASLRVDAIAAFAPRNDNEAARYACAGELAMAPGGRAVSRLILSDLIMGSTNSLTAALITDCHLDDPFIGMTVVRPSPTCIAWHSRCPADHIEESPLFEAVITACEQATFLPGHGAIHVIETDAVDETIWAVGDGADLLNIPATAHNYS